MEMTMPVRTLIGALACQKDSYLKQLTTVVVSCSPLKEEAPKKAGKKLSVTDSKEKRSLYEIELENTILFPEGGGQPSDLGLIKVEDTKVRVLDVQRKGLYAVHITEEPIESGTSVSLEVDWKRRLDHMQQHTGQHLLSAILDKYDLPTLSWNMGEMVNYIEVPRKITPEEIVEVTEKVNHEIFNNTPINVDTPKSESEGVNSEKGVMRVVKIGDIDNNPCCGTHLAQVGQVKMVVILGQMNGKNGTSKLNFLCGDRVYKYTSQLYDINKRLMNIFSSNMEELPEKAEMVIKEGKKSRARERNLSKEIAIQFANRIIEAFQDKQSPKSVHYVYREEGDLEFINKINAELKIILSEHPDKSIVLISGDGAIIVVGPAMDSIVQELRKRLPTLRGGGKNGRFQGKVASYKEHEMQAVIEYLKEL